MVRTWFTADTHFGHENIIKYCNRPFKDLKHMENVLVRNWNERVKPEDTIIILGDFCFTNTSGGKEGEGTTKKSQYYLDKLNGNKVFIGGNHDKNNSVKSHITGLEIFLGGQHFWCVHNPEDCNMGYDINLCGHVHEAWKEKEKYGTVLINVGVDVWNFRPVKIEEIFSLF